MPVSIEIQISLEDVVDGKLLEYVIQNPAPRAGGVTLSKGSLGTIYMILSPKGGVGSPSETVPPASLFQRSAVVSSESMDSYCILGLPETERLG